MAQHEQSSSSAGELLRVRVLGDRGFSSEWGKLTASVSFAGDVKSAPLGGEASLLFGPISRPELRKLRATGAGECKLTVMGESGERLGWVILDLRSARLRAADEGRLLVLRGVRRPGGRRRAASFAH